MFKKISLLMIVTMCIFIGACSAAEEKAPEEDNAPQQNEQNNNAENVNYSEVIYDQWSKSGHAKAIDEDDPENAPGMREGGNCYKCHNGYAFELNPESIEGIGILKGTSCDSCHTKYGYKVLKDGTVKIPLGDIKGGKGSLCIACHNGRGKEPNQENAPHHSVQTDMLLSKSGAEVEGVDYKKSPHANGDQTCLECHMSEGDNGVINHSFKFIDEMAATSCSPCHKYDNLNPTAKGDYDGNGNKQGIQDEVKGLLKIVENAINEKLDGGKFSSGHGDILWEDANGKALDAPPSEELYNAAWNFFFVSYDASNGIHNGPYAVQLLQQSYKALTGKDVPNADIR